MKYPSFFHKIALIASFILSQDDDKPNASSADEAPRRLRKVPAKSYKDMSHDDNEEKDEDVVINTSEEEDDSMDVEDDESFGRKRRPKRTTNSITVSKTPSAATRISSRSTKFTGGMAEPSESLKGLFDKPAKFDVDEDAEVIRKPRVRTKPTPRSPTKCPARQHAQQRRSLAEELPALSGSSSEDDEEEADELSEAGEEEDPLKVQRILASRTETKRTWKEIGITMNTSEIHYGSRWFQKDNTIAAPEKSEDSAFEERFLVKWAGLSFLHTSWETEVDLIDQCDAKTYMTTFFRKAVGGLLYSQDERCDGDYFDPAYTQIERILEVIVPEDYSNHDGKMTVETEDSFDEKSFGMIMDKADPKFDNGTGRQFLVKWTNLPYADATYEFERDLIMNDIDYKDQVKDFLQRSKKPDKTARRIFLKKGEEEYKRLYSFFGDKSNMEESDREAAVEAYTKDLQQRVYKNGGQIRDYQAEGVAWMLANFVNQRSGLLADEMGLGKVR
jgi:hypothetical protein